MNKEESYAKIASLLVSIMPTKWEQVVFSLLVRKCIVYRIPRRKRRYISKEFQCKCIKQNSKNIINIVEASENNFSVQDIILDIMGLLYNLYNDSSKDSDWNFIMFKLYSNGQYEVKVFSNIDDRFDAKIINNTVDKFLITES